MAKLVDITQKERVMRDMLEEMLHHAQGKRKIEVSNLNIAFERLLLNAGYSNERYLEFDRCRQSIVLSVGSFCYDPLKMLSDAQMRLALIKGYVK